MSEAAQHLGEGGGDRLEPFADILAVPDLARRDPRRHLGQERVVPLRHVAADGEVLDAGAPGLGAAGIRSALLNSTTPTASLAGLTVTGGRLDVGNLVDACLPPTAPVDGSVGNLAPGAVTTKSVALTWTSDSSNESGFEIQAAPGTLGACGSFATIGSAGANATGTTVSGLVHSTDYCFRVRAVNGYGGGSATAWSAIVSARTAAPPPPYVCSAATYAWVDPAGVSSVQALVKDIYSTPPEVAQERAVQRAAQDASRERDRYERDAQLQRDTHGAYVSLAEAGWVSPWIRTSDAGTIMQAVKDFYAKEP